MLLTTLKKRLFSYFEEPKKKQKCVKQYINYTVDFDGNTIDLKNRDTGELIRSFLIGEIIEGLTIQCPKNRIFQTMPDKRFYMLRCDKLHYLRFAEEYPKHILQYGINKNYVVSLVTGKEVRIPNLYDLNDDYVIYKHNEDLYYQVNNLFDDEVKRLRIKKMNIEKFDLSNCSTAVYDDYFIVLYNGNFIVHDLSSNKTIYKHKNITRFSVRTHIYLYFLNVIIKLRIDLDKVAEEIVTYTEENDLLMSEEDYEEYAKKVYDELISYIAIGPLLTIIIKYLE